MSPRPCSVPRPQPHLPPGTRALPRAPRQDAVFFPNVTEARAWRQLRLSAPACSAHRYERLGEVVELLFPPVARGPSTDLPNPEYSNFCYWREPLITVDLDVLA